MATYYTPQNGTIGLQLWTWQSHCLHDNKPKSTGIHSFKRLWQSTKRVITFSLARPACFWTDLARSELLLSAIFRSPRIESNWSWDLTFHWSFMAEHRLLTTWTRHRVTNTARATLSPSTLHFHNLLFFANSINYSILYCNILYSLYLCWLFLGRKTRGTTAVAQYASISIYKRLRCTSLLIMIG